MRVVSLALVLAAACGPQSAPAETKPAGAERAADGSAEAEPAAGPKPPAVTPRALLGLTNEFQLPEADEAALRSGPVVKVGAEAVVFDEKHLVGLTDGRLAEGAGGDGLLPGLFDALAEEVDRNKVLAEQTGEPFEGRLILAVDRRVPFETLVPVLFTAGRAGFVEFSFVVARPGGDELAALTVVPPKFGARQRTPASMSIELSPGRFSLSTGPAAELPATKGRTGADGSTVATYAADLVKRDPGLERLVVSAKPPTPFGEIVAVVGRARGACRVSGPECRFTEVILTTSGAHRTTGVAAVLGTYADSGDGTVFDVIEGTEEKDLGELFAEGMSKSVVADGETPEGDVSIASSTVEGDVDEKTVRAVARRRVGGLKACYNKALRDHPGREGNLGFEMTVSTTGRVKKLEVTTDTVVTKSLRACVQAKIRGWRFPTEGAKSEARVSLLLEFAPKE